MKHQVCDPTPRHKKITLQGGKEGRGEREGEREREGKHPLYEYPHNLNVVRI
jgi:hypothetical protein